MSKVVKGIGRAIGKVVKGIGKAVNSVVKSKIFKVILTAAAVYFTAGAALGAIGGASAGTGFLGTLSGAVSGAGAGLTSAMNGLSGAFTALGSGSLSGAASSLSGGLSGASAAGSAAVSGVMPGVGSSAFLGGAAPIAPVGAAPGTLDLVGSTAWGSAPGSTLGVATPGNFGALTAGPTSGGGGFMSGLINSKMAPALVTVGGSMLAGQMQAKSTEQASAAGRARANAAQSVDNIDVRSPWAKPTVYSAMNNRGQ